ncbi:hypothetical protein [Burkholderia cepacia]|uniref:hypothetical protein n=1 Tax=Burkholderia cepacia TaxID=292 RepID=UPI000AC82319|nr:hypothetical protein [Burkholderia cepacia]
MINFGFGLFFVGIMVGLVGIGGFVDTRKVDRRFKTGYKNNEPDTRNFGRAGKRVLYGIGICITGAAIISLTSPSEHSSSASANETPSQAVQESNNKITTANPVVAIEPQGASPQVDNRPSDSGVALGSNERVVAPEVTTATAGSESSVASTISAQDVTAHPSAAGISCAEDGTFFGANVCRNQALATAYTSELKEYEAAQARIGGKDVGVRVEQEAWLEKVTKECVDSACLTAAFDSRIADLRSRYR